MAAKIEHEDDKVIRLTFPGDRMPEPFALCTASARVLYEDDHVMLTRVSFRIGGHEWHEHMTHEFDADDEPGA